MVLFRYKIGKVEISEPIITTKADENSKFYSTCQEKFEKTFLKEKNYQKKNLNNIVKKEDVIREFVPSKGAKLIIEGETSGSNPELELKSRKRMNKREFLHFRINKEKERKKRGRKSLKESSITNNRTKKIHSIEDFTNPEYKSNNNENINTLDPQSQNSKNNDSEVLNLGHLDNSKDKFKSKFGNSIEKKYYEMEEGKWANRKRKSNRTNLQPKNKSSPYNPAFGRDSNKQKKIMNSKNIIVSSQEKLSDIFFSEAPKLNLSIENYVKKELEKDLELERTNLEFRENLVEKMGRNEKPSYSNNYFYGAPADQQNSFENSIRKLPLVRRKTETNFKQFRSRASSFHGKKTIERLYNLGTAKFKKRPVKKRLTFYNY